MRLGKTVSRNTTGAERHNVTVNNSNLPNFGLLALLDDQKMDIRELDNVSQPTIISYPWSRKHAEENRSITPMGTGLLPRGIHESIPHKSYTVKSSFLNSANCSGTRSCNEERSRSRSPPKKKNLLMRSRSGSMSPPLLPPKASQSKMSRQDQFESQSNNNFAEIHSNLQTATSQLRHLLNVKQQQDDSSSMLSGFGRVNVSYPQRDPCRSPTSSGALNLPKHQSKGSDVLEQCIKTSKIPRTQSNMSMTSKDKTYSHHHQKSSIGTGWLKRV